MDNPEEVMQILERFNVARNPEITAQLEEYITFVARTGDSVYAWSLVKNLYREKLINVITDFYNETPTKELPQYPNVDPFNYETMKKVLIEKLDSFAAAPFTIQRISELLSDPRKQYSRIDKFMRAVEKTILVVSTVPPGRHRSESENGDSLDSALNGDFSSEVNVDIDMDQDGSFAVTKDTSVTMHTKEENHEVTTVAQETITIKKTADDVDKPETSVTVENVAITVIEPTKSEENPVNTEESLEKADTLEVPAPEVTPETETGSDKPETKVRSAENEILVDTSEIISETTPLAALENIVAIRTEPEVVVQPEVVAQPEDVAQPEVVAQPEISAQSEVVAQPEIISQPEVLPQPEVIPSETGSHAKTESDESEIEAKRQKIEEVAVEPPFVVEEVATVAVEVPVAPLIPELVEEPAKEQVEAPAAEVSVIQEQIPEKIDEPEVPEISPAEDIAEVIPPATEMETVPIVTENTMSLDEDEPPATEQEMTPIANKMDTDDAEAAPMEFEDEAEPMDQ